MFREPVAQDRELMLTLFDEFYHSPGVLHPVPRVNFERTFDALMAKSPYLKAFLIECDDEPAGYALLSVSHSNEAGGLAVWADEIYVRPAFQGRGLGSQFFTFLDQSFGKIAARIRLEVEPDNIGAIRLYERLGFQPLPYRQMIRDQVL